MNRLHQKLTQKYPKYNNWHQTKHHNKIHWGVLAVFTLLVFGTISRWTPIVFAAPTAPTNLTATVVSSSQINLSWTASTDDTGVTGYKIYRCAGSTCAPTIQIATSATNSYSNTGLTASTAYTYTVSAYDAAGNESGKSGSVNGTTQAPPTSTNPIDNLQPGQWYEVPNSKLALANVIPNPVPPGYVGPDAVMSAWSGGAYDTKRDRLVIWGGGHGDYGGNEIYTFDINTLSWSRIWGPSPNIPAVGGSCYETYDDGNPVSKHTYEGLEYIPGTDKFWAQGGSRYCGPGGGSNATWEFNLNNLVWERKSDAPSSMLGVVSAYDPVTGHVFQQGINKFSEYDPLTGTYTVVGNEPSAGWWEDALAGALDPERRLFVAVGNGYVRVWNLSTKQYSQVTTTGGSAIVTARGPGFAYDPVSKKFVGWYGGADIYTLDMNTLIWTKHPLAVTNLVIPTPSARVGTYGRFRYIPSKNAFIVVNSINGNVFIYKLSQGVGIPPPPDTTAPTVSITAPASNSTVSGTVTVSATALDNIGVVGVQFKLDGVNLSAEDTISPYSIAWDTTKATNGSHTLTAVARDTAGNIAASASVTVTVSNTVQPPPPPLTTGQIGIPLNTWVTRPVPSVGQGPSGVMKHLRLTHNPVNGRIYVEGGDYTGPIGFDSGRNETYSYSILDNTWKLEFPYCGPAGSVQPSHPDQVGWVYDTKRNIFWMLPGYQGADQGDCPQSNLIKGKIMTFDPTTVTWNSSTRSTNITGEATGFAQYDPVTDTIIRFVDTKALVYDIATDIWTNIPYSSDVNGVPIMSNADWGRGYTAMDLAYRHIYIISPFESRLYRYDMDTKKVKYLVNTPVPTPTPDNIADRMMPIWDSVNKVLLWPQIFDNSGKGMKFHVYHPDTNMWEANIPINQPEGLEVRGNSVVFDPNQNVLLLMGGGGGQPPNPYIFLYRYGNGSGTPPPTGNVINANPTNYLSLLPTLKPGDTLLLESGTYTANGLPVDTLNGISGQPITIKGSDTGSRPVIVGSAGQNTVRIRNSSHVIIKNLEIDGRNLGGDPVNGESTSHHITLENLYIHGFSDDQGTVGISTNQAPVWNWTIRNNIITDGGTGMYLGNSPGTEPFIGGLIEGNLIYDTIGYNIEIKHQLPRPTNIPGMPTAPQKTIIRHNVFSKANKASTGGMARPNLLVGHFPLSGSGQDDRYEIYGNFFYQNPTGEPLFQGEGNIGLYNNLFFNSVAPASSYASVLIAPHNDKPRDIRIFHNTIVTKDKGISVSGGYTTFQQKVIANAVFAATPISAPDQQDNITDTYANAINYLVSPFAPLGTFDLYPLANKLTGTTLDTASYNIYTDWNKDFNGDDHTHTFRGAYTKEVQNSGWLPKMERKPIASGSVPRDTTAPTIPTNLTATTVSSTQINLSWTASTDDVGVTGYKIYRCVGSGCAPTQSVNSQSVNSLIYNDTGLSPSTAYTYAVSAYDAAGNESGKSGVVSATTLSQFKPSDLNQDQKIDQQDFDILKQDWRRTDKPASDLNQDGIVDSRDLGILMSEWTR